MNTLVRRELEHAWASALQALDPAQLVFDQLRTSREQATGKSLQTPTIIASGKAAIAMATGACAALQGEPQGVVVTTDTIPDSDLPTSLVTLRASHPIPDTRSVDAARRTLRTARGCQDGVLHVLISGGTSSLLCSPHGLTLHSKQELTDRLLRSGASIQECNTVRRHLSAIKGGRLAAACRARVHCHIISDVVGGEPHDVGSGPACSDPTSVEDAVHVIRKYLSGPIAETGVRAMSESVKPFDAVGQRNTANILAQPKDLARRFAEALRHKGWDAKHGSLAQTSAVELSNALVRRAHALRADEAWIVACEPTLQVPSAAGKGGRAGWVALHAWRSLPADVMLWAAASDGVDGSSGASGACVQGWTETPASEHIARCLEARDDGSFHKAMGSALSTGPTGLNMTDVYAVLRVRQRPTRR